MENEKSNVTVQGVIKPVPAVSESVKTGSQPSISYYCNTSNAVAHLDNLEVKATSKFNNKERRNVENLFRRSFGIARSP